MNIYDVFHFIFPWKPKEHDRDSDPGKDRTHVEKMTFNGDVYVMLYQQTVDTPSIDRWEAAILTIKDNAIVICAHRTMDKRFYSDSLMEKILVEERLKELKEREQRWGIE